MVWNAHVQLHILLFWYVLDEHSCTFSGARVSHVCGVLLKFMSSLRLQFVSLWSTQKGWNNPKLSISIQYVIENVYLKRGEYHLQVSFYTKGNELILILSFTQQVHRPIGGPIGRPDTQANKTMDFNQIYLRQI